LCRPRISGKSFAVFLPKHKLVYEAIKKRDAAAAHDSMKHMLSETQVFMQDHIDAPT
jgi:DNA-binding FadR family transcriptional regulator